MKKDGVKEITTPAVVQEIFHDSFVPRTRVKTGRSQSRSPKKSSELNDAERLRQIYRAAAMLFCEKGYDATSMNDIAEEVGITKAGVYHFIKGSKQDLLFEIINYGLEALYSAVIQPAKTIQDPEERLQFIINNHVKIIISGSTPHGYNPVTIVVEEVSALSPAQIQLVNERKRIYFELLRHTLQELKECQKLRDIDITVAAFSILASIVWIARWYVPTGRLSPEDVATEISKMIFGGLLKNSSPPIET